MEKCNFHALYVIYCEVKSRRFYILMKTKHTSLLSKQLQEIFLSTKFCNFSALLFSKFTTLETLSSCTRQFAHICLSSVYTRSGRKSAINTAASRWVYRARSEINIRNALGRALRFASMPDVVRERVEVAHVPSLAGACKREDDPAPNY
jgi:hypothetical protein